MRLSDSLHGAADDAPVEGMHVSAVEAARRVQRKRAVKASGTGLLATAGVALLAVGVVVPNLGNSANDESADMAAGLPESAADSAGGTMLAAGFCGGTVDGLAYGTPTVTLDGSLGTDGDAEPGDTVPFTATTTALEDVSLAAGRPLTSAYVLWDGIVVGTYPGVDDVFTDDLVLLELASGESSTDESGVTLTNCWDGEPLPAGKYEIVLAQEFWSAEPFPEPTLPTDPDTTAVPEETFMPEPDFTEEVVEPSEPTVVPADPDEAVTTDGSDADTSTSDSAATSGLAADQGFRVVTDPLELTIAGDAVEDPFADYLDWTDPGVIETPDDLLTPDAARSLYEKGKAGSWDMAPGTQRVVLTNDSTTAEGDLWSSRWFGCSYESGVDASFPDESADLDLLDVSVPLPSRISVSYGWVVDGNPEIDSQVTNTSEWTLPFWDGGQPNLVLVKDGRVVAQAYPTNADRGGDYAIMEDAAAAAESGASSLIAPDSYYDSYMSPGESYGGTYLWREVSTCDYDESLTAGTYTVLDQRSIYVDSGVGYYEEDIAWSEDLADEGSESEGSFGSAEAMPVPDPDANYDWVELTVWTSLGTVTVTA